MNPSQHVIDVLKAALDDAQAGRIQAVLIGTITQDGGAAVSATSMSAVMMNHLSRILDRRVARMYDRVEASQLAATAPVPATGKRQRGVGGDAPPLPPRKVRRAVAKQLQKAVRGTKAMPSPAPSTKQ